MKKIAFVSSYDESCGNASFTEVLMDSVREKGYTVDCLKLNLELTNSINSKIRKKADLHINELCEQLREYDGVNIQFEAGLYGTYPSDIVNRVLNLARANKNTSITLHSPRLIPKSSNERSYIKKILTGHIFSALKEYLLFKKTNIHYEINQNIISELAKLNKTFIVHTKRAKDQINTLYGYNNVIVHPLMFVSSNFTVDHTHMNRVKKHIGLLDTDIIIGMFGYISEYKGHTIALEALKFLPKNYKLLIFGRTHPQTIEIGKVDQYLLKLQDIIRKSYGNDKKDDESGFKKPDNKSAELTLIDRVYFMGEYPTVEFEQLAATSDIVWMPYMEVAQDGSGIASICLDVSNKVICSTAFSFEELFKLIKYNNVYKFDIGNALELASKTKMALADSSLSVQRDQDYSISSQAISYIDALFKVK